MSRLPPNFSVLSSTTALYTGASDTPRPDAENTSSIFACAARRKRKTMILLALSAIAALGIFATAMYIREVSDALYDDSLNIIFRNDNPFDIR